MAESWPQSDREFLRSPSGLSFHLVGTRGSWEIRERISDLPETRGTQLTSKGFRSPSFHFIGDFAEDGQVVSLFAHSASFFVLP